MWDAYDNFIDGGTNITQFARELAACVQGPVEPDADLEEDAKERVELLHSLTNHGVTWEDFETIFQACTSEPNGAGVVPGAIRGSGAWAEDERVRVFLDLDGVVSPILLHDRDRSFETVVQDPLVNPGEPPLTGWNEWTNETISFGPAPVPRELLNQIAQLGSEPRVTVSWLTSWQEQANAFFEDLGMPNRLPVFRFDFSTKQNINKWSTVAAEHERNPVPFVWIDDYIGFDEYRWARHLDVDALVIRTNTYHGITPECWTHIESWVEQYV